MKELLVQVISFIPIFPGGGTKIIGNYHRFEKLRKFFFFFLMYETSSHSFLIDTS